MSQHGPVTTPPINRLPFDVLSNIFFFALPNDLELNRLSSMNDRRGNRTDPLMLCGVCSLWQSFVFAAPQLWTQVFVHMGGMSITEAQSKAAKLDEWIRRSGVLPLTLYISHQYKAVLTEGSIVPTAELLNRYAARWEAMYFQSGRDEDSLSEWLRCEEWSALRRIFSFGTVDALHKNQSIPWPQLTHLHISEGTAGRGALEIFTRCRKLVSVSLSFKYVESAPLTSPIILHDLEAIELCTDDLSAVIRQISAPSLKEIAIQSSWSVPTDTEFFLAFLSRSACTLDSLKITGEPFHSGTFVRCLAHRSCYSLTQLKIVPFVHARAIDYRVIQRLTFFEDGEYSMCPRLKSLWLEFSCNDAGLSATANLVESRLGPRRLQPPSTELWTGWRFGHGRVSPISGFASPVERRLDFLHLQINVMRNNTFDSNHRLFEVVKGSKMQHDIRITNSEHWCSVIVTVSTK